MIQTIGLRGRAFGVAARFLDRGLGFALPELRFSATKAGRFLRGPLMENPLFACLTSSLRCFGSDVERVPGELGAN